MKLFILLFGLISNSAMALDVYRCGHGLGPSAPAEAIIQIIDNPYLPNLVADIELHTATSNGRTIHGTFSGSKGNNVDFRGPGSYDGNIQGNIVIYEHGSDSKVHLAGIYAGGNEMIEFGYGLWMQCLKDGE